MKTVVLDPAPVEVTQLIEQRERLGLDRYDEVWEGVYHMVPGPRGLHGYVDDQLARVLAPYADGAGLYGTGPFNLGDADDFRVPDRGYHRELPTDAVYVASAALVVEVLSPGDESLDKLPFYALHGVEEVFLVDPVERRIRCLSLDAGRYTEHDRSAVLEVTTAELETGVNWL